MIILQAFTRLHTRSGRSARRNYSDSTRIRFAVVPAGSLIFEFVSAFCFFQQRKLKNILGFCGSFSIVLKNVCRIYKKTSQFSTFVAYFLREKNRQKNLDVNTGPFWKQNKLCKIKFKFDFNLKTNKVFIIFSLIIGILEIR